jgi:membrane fusion protein, multidrug efflux system
MAETGQKAKGRTVHLLGIGAVIVCLLLIVVLLLLRNRSVHEEQKSRRGDLAAGARVQVAIAKRGPTERTIAITGEARPYATATIYAKVSGYLKEMRVDKGDRVEKGDLLARLTSPELESQYQAALAEARNRRRFANRELSLLKDGIISRQEADDAITAAKSAEANAAALRTQRGYLEIRAPFAAVVTARYADPGALLQSAATGQTAALAVVTLSRTDRLRIYLYLDQKAAGQVKVGDKAEVTDPARPERKFPAQVTRISGELDPKTRTMLCELELADSQEGLLAGGFVNATLRIAVPPYVEVPAAAVNTREEKSYVAVVRDNNTVTFRTVTIADSDGKSIRISDGVKEGERVALNPGTGLTEGEKVQPVLQDGGAGR